MPSATTEGLARVVLDVVTVLALRQIAADAPPGAVPLWTIGPALADGAGFEVDLPAGPLRALERDRRPGETLSAVIRRRLGVGL